MKSKTQKSKIENDQIKAFDELITQFNENSDRAAIILGVAKLDYLLYQLLDFYLISNYTSDEPLLEGDRPLSTFSSRINLSYRLGLIDADFAKALQLIRKIRNEFAHGVNDSKLSDPPHRDRTKELALIFKYTVVFPEVRKMYFSDLTESSAVFFTSLAILIMRLETIILKIDPIEPNKAYGIKIS